MIANILSGVSFSFDPPPRRRQEFLRVISRACFAYPVRIVEFIMESRLNSVWTPSFHLFALFFALPKNAA